MYLKAILLKTRLLPVDVCPIQSVPDLETGLSVYSFRLAVDVSFCDSDDVGGLLPQPQFWNKFWLRCLVKFCHFHTNLYSRFICSD